MEQPDDTRDRLIMILTSPAHMSLQLSVADIDDDTSPWARLNPAARIQHGN